MYLHPNIIYSIPCDQIIQRVTKVTVHLALCIFVNLTNRIHVAVHHSAGGKFDQSECKSWQVSASVYKAWPNSVASTCRFNLNLIV